ncbi:MAG: Gldg family protein [Candidatus Krumholzibacteria bacterium]|nr:Gldg family protein [Candidatus Krumholzibacteria bacterium]
MERLRRILGPLGLVLVIAGGLIYGILSSSGWPAVVPLVIGIALVAASAALNLRGARSEGSKRNARFGINAAVSILAFAAILVLLQMLASRHGVAFDTTANKRFSLSPQTVKILDRLGKEVVFTCFFKADAPDRTALADLLREYADENPRVKYSFIDPDKDPVAARRYKIRSYGTIVVESGGSEEQIAQTTEEKLTNAILKVTRDTKRIIYCLTGHGEKSIDDAQPAGLSGLKSSVEAEGYAIRNLLTLRDSIPPDCAILLIPGPEKDLYAPERGMIERFMSGGGSILVLIDPLVDVPRLENIVEGYGIEVTKSIVVDRFAKLVSGNYLTPVVNQYGKHAITEGFKVASFFPQVRALAAAKEKPAGVEIEVLASTGASAFAETNLAEALKGKTRYEPDRDLAGPLAVAVVAKKEIAPSPARNVGAGGGARNGRIVVFGDSDFASNAYLDLSGNRDLILNTIGWLAEEEDLIAVRAKDPVSQPVILNMRQGRTVFWLPVVGLPAIVGCIGVLVLVHRRRSA